MVVLSDGRPVPRAPNYAVLIPHNLSLVPVCAGQRWRITGIPMAVEFQTADGWTVEEMRLTATSAVLERTSGSHIVALLAGEQFPGVGPVTAQRAWDALGEGLYNALDEADHDALAAAVGFKHARVLIDGWTYHCSTDLLQWMQRVNLDVRMGRKLLKLYGRSALQRLRDDPYRLLALGMSWLQVDALAAQEFEISPEDPRRLAAAVEAELYDAFDRGDTFALADQVVKAVGKRLGKPLAQRALEAATTTGVVLSSNDCVYAPGPYLLENLVSAALVSRIRRAAHLFSQAQVEELVNEFEREERARIGMATFCLNSAQRLAVQEAASHAVFCLIGGAGVGKTTTLKAIAFMLERADLQVYLLAPTGKAAKRMRQATGKPTMTIAGFLRNTAPKGISSEAVLVVDESSMLDVSVAYQLLNSVPAEVRLILIGDSAQLPPVGPGLTLHELAASDAIPQVELTEGKRFSGGIAICANAIRQGQWFTAANDVAAEVSFISCSAEELAGQVVSAYLRDPSNSQVLCCTKESGAAPSRTVNALCQAALGAKAKRLTVYSEERQRLEDTGFRLGDPVMCSVNLWDHDLQNGSIGRLVQIEPSPLPWLDESGVRIGTVYGWIEWDDGVRRPLIDEVLDALELAYAITVHKSQGSEVPVAIVPIYRSSNLDRALLYTAVTRARRKVILLGDVDAARAAIVAEPHALRRKVMLRQLIEAKVTSDV